MKIYTFHVINIPKGCQSTDKIYPYLRELKKLRIYWIFFNRLGDLFVQTPDINGDQEIAKLEVIFQTNLDIYLLPSAKTYSCVIGNVDFNITWQDIRDHVYHRIIDVGRIRSYMTDIQTLYVRLVFADERSRDCMVCSGVVIYGKEYDIEMPHFEPDSDLTRNLRQGSKVEKQSWVPLSKFKLNLEQLNSSDTPALPDLPADTSSCSTSTCTVVARPEEPTVDSSVTEETAEEDNEETILRFLHQHASVENLLLLICAVVMIYYWFMLFSQKKKCSEK